jgi:hypothetical protein
LEFSSLDALQARNTQIALVEVSYMRGCLLAPVYVAKFLLYLIFDLFFSNLFIKLIVKGNLKNIKKHSGLERIDYVEHLLEVIEKFEIPDLNLRLQLIDTLMELREQREFRGEKLLFSASEKLCNELVTYTCLAGWCEKEGRLEKAADFYYSGGDYASFARVKKPKTHGDYLKLANAFEELDDLSSANQNLLKAVSLLPEENRHSFIDFQLISKYGANTPEMLAGLEIYCTDTWGKKLAYILSRYYINAKDYENTKILLLLCYDYATPSEAMQAYNDLKLYLSPEDWSKMSESLLELLKEKSIKDYLSHCREEMQYLKMLQALPNSKLTMNEIDEYLKEAIVELPQETAEFFVIKAHSCIARKSRDYYRTAVAYLEKAQKLYIEVIEDKKSWEKILAKIKYDYKNLTAFQQEASELFEVLS